MRYLEKINKPNDIKNLSINELNLLSGELREFLIDTVSKTGGHLASNLGVIELTLALFYVFNFEKDRIVWDVGHQTYIHKIITGRKDKFHTLRKYEGISGFPKPTESSYDHFVTGHSSTSISAALGMARARDLKGEKHNVIAVIGDGALTGGMAFEALNDAGSSKTNLIVILNDNEMSISQNVGSLSCYLSKIRTAPAYINFRDEIEQMLKKIPAVGNNLYKSAEKFKDGLKHLVVQGMLFEELGFKYLGPIDGHNIEVLTDVLKRAQTIKGPVIIHTITKKGRGYCYAEENPEIFHGVDAFEIETGERIAKRKETYSKVFGEEIVREAEDNNKIIAITAAMPDGTGLTEFSEKFPERFYDVGIAEQHAATMAAGLAKEGFKPIFAVYSTFLQRAFDQVIHDICIQRLPVILSIDRAGIVGEDGETHQGVFDLSYLRLIPNLTILSPKDLVEFRYMLRWCFKQNNPIAIRYPRGGDLDIKFDKYDDINLGKWERLLIGNKVTILAVGKMVQHSMKAAVRLKGRGIDVELINCRFIKPLDKTMLDNLIERSDHIFTVEDNVLYGGFGSAINEYLISKNYKGKVVNIAFPDEFIPHGSVDILYKKYGLDPDGIYNTIIKNID
ncbi:1-deoxy-D-xylulose-5-phosphate synthase [Caloramator proteoclasticus]|uniref:1-deoxy-D-xylulose-5-phosphate synthase n=1 Tax=Caloramator proteoclasticus DSM 10124 TaxID=1121262 RepID=A0A1M4Y759_9CLOT|nr:1-deoxy-D-xylulose-5-phosphate synthase [Caloramator proteoclasticus]SHF01509.1 1-deoxy-D-xylulose-5-phosphate synthase [Caloramator proteoclasticus DSM 10124]